MHSANLRKLSLIAITLTSLLAPAAFGQTTPPAGKSARKQTTSTAQSDAKRQWYYISESNLKPGVANEYYEFRAKERVPALMKAGYKHQEFWIPAIGAMGKIYTVETFDDLSLFGLDQNRLTKALGEDAARSLAAKTSQYLTGGGHTWLAQTRPELSWTEQMTAPPKFAIVHRIKIARGRRADYENYVKNDYLPIVKKSGALGYSLLQVVYGGDALEYVSSVYFNSFTEIEKNDPSANSTVTRIVGAATAQKNSQKLVGVILELDRSILRFRPDLSILPK